MELFAIHSSLLYLLVIISSTSLGRAAIIPSVNQSPTSEENILAARQCATPCGFYSQVCCAANEVCITDSNNQAQCGPAGESAAAAEGQGNWQYYTTTFVQTDLKTITTTFSSFFPISTQNLVIPTTASVQCQYSLGEIPCGNTCCSAGQYCMADINECAAAGGGSSAFFSSFYTQAPSAPVRPTSNTVLTVTSTGAATATVPFQAPVGTDGSTVIGAQPTTQGRRLSGGAIAGIVIGVILGLILLFLICLYCCAKGAIDGILGLFGGRRNRRRTETTYIEERRSRRGSRPGDRTWLGSAPARVDRVEKKTTKTGGLGGLAGVGAGLTALALLLGLKRKRAQRNDAKSSSSYSYYDESYTGTSESSLSSDRRTRDSRRSRRG